MLFTDTVAKDPHLRRKAATWLCVLFGVVFVRAEDFPVFLIFLPCVSSEGRNDQLAG